MGLYKSHTLYSIHKGVTMRSIFRNPAQIFTICKLDLKRKKKNIYVYLEQ